MLKFLRVLALVVALCVFLSACAGDWILGKHGQSEEMVGVWLTYSEIAAMCKSAAGFEAEFGAALTQMKQININNLFFHTVAFCDAVYNSAVFPKANYCGETDILEIAVRLCHQKGIKIHAWINPYRVSNSSADYNLLPDKSPAKIWLTDQSAENDHNVCFSGGGIYLNPARLECRQLIISGVREIITNYNVDGIHFDDYFYPTTNADFDEKSYKEYQSSSEMPLSLEEWRRVNVNNLIMGVYAAIKTHKNSLLFGISPAADLERCYNTLFADIEGWIGGGYIDYIMPQIYFGFLYPAEKFTFDALLTRWMDLTSGKDVKLYCGLANYKAGTDSEPDAAEWGSDDAIIARQIDRLRDNDICGFCFFSYSSLFGSTEHQKAQLKNIKTRL